MLCDMICTVFPIKSRPWWLLCLHLNSILKKRIVHSNNINAINFFFFWLVVAKKLQHSNYLSSSKSYLENYFMKIIPVFCYWYVNNVVIRFRSEGTLFKVFWSSGRPLLCFSRFWPSENVARIRRVYFVYSRTKSVHTRNIDSNAKGKCVFCFDCAKWSHYFIHRWALAARTKFHDVSTNEKRKNLARMVTSKILCKRQKWGRSRPICLHIFALLVLNLV